MKRWLIWTPLAVMVALAVLFAGYALKHDPKFIPDALVGKPAPDIAVAPLGSEGPPVPVRSTLHQGATLIRPDGPAMPPVYVIPLVTMIFAYTFLFGALWLTRIRAEVWRRKAGAQALAAAG